ncbi:hypothetical protein GVAV_000548 [Gurleya vavrai]
MAKLIGLNENDVLRKIRNGFIPDKYKPLILGTDLGIDTMIERIKIWHQSDVGEFKKKR